MMQNYSLKKMLESLDIPESSSGNSGSLQNLSANEFVLRIPDFITPSRVRQLWNEWNPGEPDRLDDPVFFDTFHKTLREGAGMGFKLSRFKEISKKLPKPNLNSRNWMPFFEDVVANCELRVHLNKEDHENWLGNLSGSEDDGLKKSLDMMVDGLFYELGIVFPQINFLIDESLPENYFRIEWNDLVLPPEQGIAGDKILVNDTVDRLTLLNVKGEEAINPANGFECSIISAQDKNVVESAGLTTWDAGGYFILKLSSKIRSNASSFVNRLLVDLLLYQLVQVYPVSVSLVQKKIEADLLVQILRGLLEEEIAIRNLPLILDKILCAQAPFQVDSSKLIVFTAAEGMISSRYDNTTDLKVRDYIEYVRISLKRYITHKYTRGGNTLIVYLLDPDIEKQLLEKKDLEQDEKSEIINAVRLEVGNLPPTAQNTVILTTVEVRHRLWKLVRPEFPNLAVVSYQELSPETNIQPIARISYP